MRKIFVGECLVRKNPESDEPPTKSENDAQVNDSAPWLVAVPNGPDEASYDEREGIGFDFCFSVGVEIPHDKKWRKQVAEPVGVVAKVFYAGCGAW